MNSARKDIRNVAIIAHVDHGKTTLLDGLLRQTGALARAAAEVERVMDREALERERGITILSKDTSIEFEGVRIHLVDTPGHADFGGEVERVLGMVDSVLLLVDAVEGVMPQTRFVVGKALEHGLAPIVVVNKIDRPEQRARAVVDEIFDLLVELGADDSQLDFPTVFASARDGVAALEPEAVREGQGSLRPLLETILERAPAPRVDPLGALQFQAVTLGRDDYLGRLVIGRVVRGELRRGAPVLRMRERGEPESFRVTKLFGTRGLERVELERAEAGDLCVVAGVDSIEIGDTLCDPEAPDPLPRITVDPPTVRVLLSPNTSPLAGRSGRFLTSRQIGERLRREALGNVSIRVEPSETPETFAVAARGELQIGILLETLRREGYEVSVSRPEIIARQVDGKRCEPVEDIVAEVPEPAAGTILERLTRRGARVHLVEQRGDRVRLELLAPSRGLFGFRGEFLSETHGEGVLYRTVRGYEPWSGAAPPRATGSLVATEAGATTAYALFNLQERATLFVAPGEPVYEGQIVGESRRPRDMNVNAVRTKKLTNIRAAGKDESLILTPPRRVEIEWAFEWLEEDELLEVTPDALRLRKRTLASSLRKRA